MYLFDRIFQKACFTLSLIAFFSISSSFATSIEPQKVDEVVEHAMKTFNVPGMAVGIIHKNEIILAKGYGVADISTGVPVDAQTNFGIASNSKAFTATALALLVDQGKLDWDDAVKKYIPEFKMYNEYVTEEFTIRDLLVHRSGLGLGAGDLMVWPDGHDFTPQDIIDNIQYLKPVSRFRTKYDYDNLLYIIAGVVIERVSGQSWQDYIQDHFLTPLEMTRTAANWNRLKDTSNAIVPHVPIDGALSIIDRYTNPIFDAAAGLYSNVEDLSKWVQFQLNLGHLPDGEQLVSKTQMQELSKPQTLMPIRTVAPYNTLFRAYGLGFVLQDVAGKLEVSHTGGLEGIVTQVIMYPQLDLGIIVLTNQQQGAAFMAVSNTIKDHYLGLPKNEWVTYYEDLIGKRTAAADEVTAEVWTTVDQNKRRDFPYKNEIMGKYRDLWFGDVEISKVKQQYRFVSKRSSQLQGDLYHYKDNIYAVKWDNRYLHADAFVYLEVENEKVVGMTMKPISPLTDFSYDFQDLDFEKVD